MKKTVFLFLTLLYFSIITTAQTSNILDSYSNSEIKVIAYNLSEMHSEGLDDVFNNLENLITNSTSLENVIEIVNSSISSHIKTFLINVLQMDSNDPIVDYPFSYDDTDPELSAEYLFSSSNGSLLPSEELSVEILRINEIISQSYTPEEIENLITDILNENTPTLENNFEKFILYSCGYIAINSSNYWQDNLELWEDKLNEINNGNAISLLSLLSSTKENSLSTNTSDNVFFRGVKISNKVTIRLDPREVIMQDVAAAGVNAVAWAAWGAAGGTMVIPGVGTIGGAAACGLFGMIRGTLTGSAGKAIVSWIRSLF